MEQTINPSAEDAESQAAQESKRIVRDGYDKMAARYLAWTASSAAVRTAHLAKLLAHLPPNPDDDNDNAAAAAAPHHVLELGCGAGVPTTQQLVRHGLRVTANDISSAQLALAARNVLPCAAPGADAAFVHADMMALAFAPASFGAVVALYAVVHLPRAEQRLLLARVWDWLVPGGVLLLNVGTRDDAGTVNADWLGASMYWSGFDEATYRALVLAAGFTVLEAEVVVDDEDGRPVPFLWILARK